MSTDLNRVGTINFMTKLIKTKRWEILYLFSDEM